MIKLNAFVSPKYEYSLFKNIPMNYLNEVKSVFKSKGQKVRFRYRGSRQYPGGDPSFCHKDKADRFSVYIRRV
jgi:hypothetical protein